MLKVEILVNGKALQEYTDTNATQDGQTTTKYIQATSGAFFAIRYCIPPSVFSSYSVRAVITIDGVVMRGSTFDRKEIQHTGMDITHESSSARIGGEALGQRFKFLELKTRETGYDVDEGVKRMVREVGLIDVSFYRVKNIRMVTPNEDRVPRPSLDSLPTLPPRAFRGLDVTHTAGLGPMQREEQVPSCTYDYADPWRHPFAAFKFKYRSAEALSARGLVPRGAAKHGRSSSQVEERPAKRQDRSGKGDEDDDDDDDDEGGDDESGNDEGDNDKGNSSLVLAFRPRR